MDAESGKTLLDRWTWLVGDNCQPLITTALGDVFFCDSNGVNFLEVQRGTTEFVDSEIAWFLNDFLAKREVVEGVLRKVMFDQLVEANGPLEYHDIFVLEPWAMLGGIDRVENYSIGKCSVYLDLVGQTLRGTQ